MSMDLFIGRTVITKASLVFQGSLEITEVQVEWSSSFLNCFLYLFHLFEQKSDFCLYAVSFTQKLSCETHECSFGC